MAGPNTSRRGFLLGGASLVGATSAKAELIDAAKSVDARIRQIERARQSDLNGGLLHFVRYFWSILEPNNPLIEGKPLEAICQHLEAVTRGEIRRLLINVPPGFMKSMLCNVFWPAWEWTVVDPTLRYVTFSYAAHLTERDNGKFRDLLRSQRFTDLWGDRFQLSEDGKIRVANNKTGWKFASSIKGVGTGERGNRVIWDDPHNIKEGESEAVREETVRWGREGMSNRLNDMERDAIIVIMQRVHEEDVSGAILSDDLDYVHLMIPMEYDFARQVDPDTGQPLATAIGWYDWRYAPRGESDGELAWPERFSAKTVAEIKRTLGPYAYTGQYQQSPEPRGGGIFKRDWWQLYRLDEKGKPLFPPHFIVASLDPAYTNKQENDPSGFTVWGVFRDGDHIAATPSEVIARPEHVTVFEDGSQGLLDLKAVQAQSTKITLLYAWQKRLELHGVDIPRVTGESDSSYAARAKKDWGLVEWVAHDCKRLQVDLLLIENKASGITVGQEIRRLYRNAKWGTQVVDPGNLDKRARAYSIQHLFADKLIYAPNRDWADMVISEFAKFRGLPGDEDNLVDAGTQALRYLRDIGLAVRHEERLEDERDKAKYRRPLKPLYET